MKEVEDLHIFDLKNTFSGHKFFRKAELRNFYRAYELDLPEKTFRRILYSLENRDIIRKIDAGVYILGDKQPRQPIKKKFSPVLSTEIISVSSSIKAMFPYVEFIIWETRILHEFMLHQPGQNQIILETEKEAAESIFNFLSDKSTGKVFLDPNRETFEKYILRNAESIIISPIITQSPLQRVNGILIPKLEKILVDVFADDEKYFVFQGQELVHIYEVAFNAYRVREKALFRYAKRRRVHQKIRLFINMETTIQLIQFGESDQ